MCLRNLCSTRKRPPDQKGTAAARHFFPVKLLLTVNTPPDSSFPNPLTLSKCANTNLQQKWIHCTSHKKRWVVVINLIPLMDYLMTTVVKGTIWGNKSGFKWKTVTCSTKSTLRFKQHFGSRLLRATPFFFEQPCHTATKCWVPACSGKSIWNVYRHTENTMNQCSY